MSNKPAVACICPTYNRPSSGHLWLLEETVESFLRQDYDGRKELLILNDTPGQTLVCKHPEVRIINAPSRFKTLGEKYNYLVAMARGEFICPWEDDDINLPHRISKSVEAVEGYSAYNPKGYFFLPYRQDESSPQRVSFERIVLHHPIGVCHNASIFNKTVWRQVNKYPLTTGAQDHEMDVRLMQSKKMAPIVPQTPEEWWYIYRWGVQPVHLSGVTPHEYFYDKVGQMPIEQGTFEIHPMWVEDYTELAAKALEQSRSCPLK